MKKTVTLCLLALLAYACQHQIDVKKITDPSKFSYVPASTVINYGVAGSSVSPIIDSGGAAVTYAILSSPVEGITINSSTGVISWISSVPVGTYAIALTATNNAGMAATTYQLKVNAVVTAPTGFVYSPGSATLLKGTAGSSGIPSINNGGSIITYSLTGTIPAGVSINSSTGEISWSNTVAAGNYTFSAKATNSIGSTTAGYTLTVNNTTTVTAPTSLAYNPASATATTGTAGSSAAPTINNGLGTITYSLTGTIAAGISINSSTGVISWTTAVVAGNYSLSVKATNSAGSITATYALTVNAASATVSFAKDILPTINNACSGCHSYTKTWSGISSHLTGCSSIQDKISTTYCGGSRMPQGGPYLSATFIAQFNAWIAQGALNN